MLNNKKIFIMFICLITILIPSIVFTETYWVSPTGTASWQSCKSLTPLEGTYACSLSTANKNAVAGDTIILRGGIYNTMIYPSNSGTPGNPITYQAYPGETPIISGHNQYGAFFGIAIEGKSFIRVTGITVKDVDRWLWIGAGASHNEISYCYFEPPAKLAIYFWRGSAERPPTTHNWFHHNLVRDNGEVSSCNDAGMLMQIGVPAYDIESGYNTIENNIFYHGGHHLIETYTMYNVIRNNIMHNEGFMDNPGGCTYGPDENGKYGNRNIQIYDEFGRDGVYNLIEGNRFGHAGAPPDDDGGDGFTLTAPKNIVRYNSIFNSQNNGILMKTGAQAAYSDNNRIYNNTIYKSGRYRNIGPQWQGANFRWYGSYERKGNVIKNNILYGYGSGGRDWYGGSSNIYSFNTVINNWCTDPQPDRCSRNGDPLFVNPDVSDPMSLNLPDLRLQPNSPAIDGGTHLTLAKGSGNNSTTLVVDDALYFQDGTWGSDLAKGITLFPDWIAIGSVDNFVEIKSINYSTNTIILKSPMSWNDRAKIWLYKKSDGERVLYGSAPDYGAHEFIPSSPSAPTPPKNLRIQ